MQGGGPPVGEQIAKGLGITPTPAAPKTAATDQMPAPKTYKEATDPNKIYSDGKGSYWGGGGSTATRGPDPNAPFDNVAAHQGVMDRSPEGGQGGSGLRRGGGGG
jgi:hypothetical protein